MCSLNNSLLAMFLLVDYEIQLLADPSTLNKSGTWVNVSWSGVVIPASDDWIGMWVLPDASASIEASKLAPVKFQVSLECELLKQMQMQLHQWYSSIEYFNVCSSIVL